MESDTSNATVIKANYITVTDPEVTDPNSPVADFSSNITKGYAPLTVQFNDLSQNAVSRSWDFENNGQEDSEEINPVYTYTSPGTYTVNLTVSNENGASSKSNTITVLKKSKSSGGSSSGGAGGSPEPAKNVEIKELSQTFITGGKTTQFDFKKNATCVVYVSFDARKNLGKTTTTAEMLKGKSALVPELPSGEVYKSFNVWVGNGGVVSSKNIENPVICFKVEKSWIQNKCIDLASITLNRYDNKKWEQMPVNISGEDEKFLYFTSNVSGYSSFAVTGKEETVTEETTTGMKPETETEEINEKDRGSAEMEEIQNQKQSQSTPGFGIDCTVICILCSLLCKNKKKSKKKN
jgi:PGF-pre-PGF domain-containing protein